jgi:acyl-[acyl-carrier-protein]-phospholipid O-acyltransferase/long-chain-fatty-acid--[acyl-carrier-protein] ligase
VTLALTTGCLADDFIRVCRRRRAAPKIADSTGRALLTRALVLRRLLRRHLLEADEQLVGLSLPPAVGSAVLNVARTPDRRGAVYLNYTLTTDVLNACM